jgi:hypothetical protein
MNQERDCTPGPVVGLLVRISPLIYQSTQVTKSSARGEEPLCGCSLDHGDRTVCFTVSQWQTYYRVNRRYLTDGGDSRLYTLEDGIGFKKLGEERRKDFVTLTTVSVEDPQDTVWAEHSIIMNFNPNIAKHFVQTCYADLSMAMTIDRKEWLEEDIGSIDGDEYLRLLSLYKIRSNEYLKRSFDKFDCGVTFDDTRIVQPGSVSVKRKEWENLEGWQKKMRTRSSLAHSCQKKRGSDFLRSRRRSQKVEVEVQVLVLVLVLVPQVGKSQNLSPRRRLEGPHWGGLDHIQARVRWLQRSVFTKWYQPRRFLLSYDYRWFRLSGAVAPCLTICVSIACRVSYYVLVKYILGSYRCPF